MFKEKLVALKELLKQNLLSPPITHHNSAGVNIITAI